MTDGATILIAEDDEDDFFFAQRVLRKARAGPILRVPSGKAAIAYLAGAPPYTERAAYPLPDILFLDLKMDHGSGLDVLHWLKANPSAMPAQVFVLSGSNEPKDREAVKQSGVTTGYIVKPITAEHVQAIFGAQPGSAVAEAHRAS
jgi:CheY-like chemotaxis protein